MDKFDSITTHKQQHNNTVDLRPKGGKTLVLGMTYVTEAEAKLARDQSKSGTSNATYRDWIRLSQLESCNYGYDVIGLSWSGDAKSSDRYIQSWVGREAVVPLLKILNANNNNKTKKKTTTLDYIFTDYFRMPGLVYFDLLGKPFINKMLFEMIHLQIVDEHTKTVLPHYRQFVYYDRFFSGEVNGYPATIQYIHAQQYPLWKATHDLVDEEGKLDGHRHYQEIYGKPSALSLFNPSSPFIVVTYSKEIIEKIRNK